MLYFKKGAWVLLDANVLLNVSSTTDDMMRFWTMMLDQRDRSDISIIVSDGVIKELVRMQTGKAWSREVNAAAQRVLPKLKELAAQGQVQIVKDHVSDHTDLVKLHADRFFINTVNNYKESKDIYVVTCDVNLMRDIYAAAAFKSLGGRPAKEVRVYKLPRDKDGFDTSHLIAFQPRDGSHADHRSKDAPSGMPSYKPRGTH